MGLVDIQAILIQLLKTIDCVLWIHALEHNKLIYINPAYNQIWGEFSGNYEEAFSVYLASIHPEDQESVIRVFNSPFQQNLTHFEYRVFNRDGNLRWIQTKRYPIANESGAIVHVVDVSYDITERKNSQISLEKFRKLFEKLLEAVPVGIFQNDAQGNCIYINQKTCEILDITLQECLGQGWVQRVHPDDLEQVIQSWNKAFSEKTFWQGEYRFLHRNRIIVWVIAQCVFIFNEEGENLGSIGSLTDITNKKELENQLEIANRELEKLVNLDSLTEVYNRRYFNEFLAREWERAKREKKPLSLIMIDVDCFKLYNDNYGHLLGDQALQLVAKSLSKLVHRPADLVARYGGEEFAVVLPYTNLEGAIHVATNITQEIAQLAIPHDYSYVSKYLTLSMGISCLIPNAEQSLETLIHQADCALYQAKRKGRNQIQWHED